VLQSIRFSTSSQRTHINQRTANLVRAFACRTLYRSGPILRSRIGFAKNRSKVRKRPTKKLVQTIKPKGFGIIVRTVAEGKNTAEIEKDLQNLIADGLQCVKITNCSPSVKGIGRAQPGFFYTARYVFNDTFTGIHVDDEELYQQVKDYVQKLRPANNR
jgi:Ribonuclease G/E